MAFKFTLSDIPEVIHIETDIHEDNRGFFLETFKSSDFQSVGINTNVVQINNSRSQRNVLRGLHFQKKPKAQGKLVTAVSGRIFDVAVDIRKNSESYGKWVGVELNADKKNMLFIPVGFAHGFCVLSETAEIIYYCTLNEYSPEHEGCIVWNDPDLNIQWPITDPLLSEKDSRGVSFKSLRL